MKPDPDDGSGGDACFLAFFDFYDLKALIFPIREDRLLASALVGGLPKSIAIEALQMVFYQARRLLP